MAHRPLRLAPELLAGPFTGLPGHTHALDTLALKTLGDHAVRFDDLGQHHRAVTTHSREAQAFFDQGLRLVYGFNHDEAARAFAHAAQLDPSCAMCFWGAALALGPNYNVPMLPGRAQAAWDALQRATALCDTAGGPSKLGSPRGPKLAPVESALIGALARRYAGPGPRDPGAQAPLNLAFAASMRAVAKAFPDDLDVQVLFAESLMDVNPWKLWTLAGQPAPGTEELVATLESVLARAPDHPGANHYYIHAIEASPHPERAEAAADRLAALIPGAGHVVHMPAHIYQRIGRYADASEANRRAIAADRRYLTRVTPPGYYGMYLAHNHGFLAYSAAMEGRRQEALEAARLSAQAVPPEMLETMPGMDFFAVAPTFVRVRFGDWDGLLAEPRPDAKYALLNVFWRYGQGMAHVGKGASGAARIDLGVLQQIRSGLSPDLHAGINDARAIADVALAALAARIAERAHAADAVERWRYAVALEDQLAYSEPADWFFPLRHCLGQVLADLGRTEEAAVVYREDLAKNPKNGWALFGLARGSANDDVARAWKRADVPLTRTCY